MSRLRILIGTDSVVFDRNNSVQTLFDCVLCILHCIAAAAAAAVWCSSCGFPCNKEMVINCCYTVGS